MSPQIEMANSAGGMETALFSLLSSSDPFYDRTPWFKPIGRGQYPLFHLSKSVNKDMFDQLFTQKIRIINQNGQLKGIFHYKNEFFINIYGFRCCNYYNFILATKRAFTCKLYYCSW